MLHNNNNALGSSLLPDCSLLCASHPLSPCTASPACARSCRVGAFASPTHHAYSPALHNGSTISNSWQVDLSQLYSSVPGGARYRLRSLACYYGRHYSAFVRLPELNDRWVM